MGGGGVSRTKELKEFLIISEIYRFGLKTVILNEKI